MPGIVAVLKWNREDGSDALADALVGGMYGDPCAEVAEADQNSGLAVRLVHPSDSPGGWARVGDILVVWQGIPHYRGTPFCEKTIVELTDRRLIAQPESWGRELTGHYQILLF
ncbi:MAG: hypothetical protein GX620_08115, partial [Chloroflexi bacterium]|nr:hypothetical protein [Chloroflexota bacterium]